MSTTQPSAVPPLVARRLDRRRVLRCGIGGLVLLAALGLLAGAAALTWALETYRDGNGYFTTATHHYRTSSYALSTQSLDVDGVTGALADRLGRLRITVTSTDASKPLFVGIARTDDVDAYLAGVAHDELRDIRFDPFGIDYRLMGTGAPTTRPGTRAFWRARTTGTGTRTISWSVEKGRWSAVVMNADGSRPVSVSAQLALRVSHAWWLVGVLLVLALSSLLGGAALVRSGARRPTRATVEA